MSSDVRKGLACAERLGLFGRNYYSLEAAPQHGGQETTITSFHTTLLHQGMVIVGVPYAEQRLLNMDEISGGSPYGASTITKGDGSCQPSENELAIARFQGKHTAEIAKKLAGR